MILQWTFVLLSISFYPTLSITVTDYDQQELIHEQSAEGHHGYKPPIPILKHEFHLDPHGYKFSYKTGNGIEAEEVGTIKNKGVKDHESIVQQGKVTYHDEHGQPITLTYIADEHGFHPQGHHLPTPPPLPPVLQKAFAEHAEAYAQEEAFHKKYAEDYEEPKEEYEVVQYEQEQVGQQAVNEEGEQEEEEPQYAHYA